MKLTSKGTQSPLGNRVTRDRVEKILKNAPRKRAPGPDGVLGETLRCLPSDAISLITRLFRCFWDSHTVPMSLKKSLTQKGDPHLVSNYRPIALANALAKAFTATITEKLSPFAEEHGVLSASQQGFRPMRGTADALRMGTSALGDAMLKLQDIVLTYVDFSSPFNTVPHGGLEHIISLLRGVTRRRCSDRSHHL